MDCEAKAVNLRVRGYLVNFEDMSSVVGRFESVNNDTVTYMMDWLTTKAGPIAEPLHVLKTEVNDDFMIQDFITYSRTAPYGDFESRLPVVYGQEYELPPYDSSPMDSDEDSRIYL